MLTTAQTILEKLQPSKNDGPVATVAKAGIAAFLKDSGVYLKQFSADVKALNQPIAPLAKIPEAQAIAFEKFLAIAKKYVSPTIRRIIEQFKTLKKENIDSMLEQLKLAHEGKIGFGVLADPRLTPIKEFASKLYPDLKLGSSPKRVDLV
jgi:hypothetical protein